MSDNILDVCYEQADISIFEVGSSNISHLDKIISHLDDALNKLEKDNYTYNYADAINDLKYLLQSEKNHYIAISDNQTNFWGFVKAQDSSLKEQFSKSFEEAMRESSFDTIYQNIEFFKFIDLFEVLDNLDGESQEILNTAFILKGLLEIGSTKGEILKLLDEFYKNGKWKNFYKGA